MFMLASGGPRRAAQDRGFVVTGDDHILEAAWLVGLAGKAVGGGQAAFTAVCSQTFHFSCISASVAHDNLVCALCNTQRRDPSFVRPTPVAPLPPAHILQPRTHPVEPVIVFDDEEQVEAHGASL
ncbi:hypothetical protein QYE76_061876 [Lolium multiflorum]|uniref:Uncharacterized protein n=1 Tax=Lolium multiflorum TaxID=4521 RepID=A0AAD8W542_LOLMU|nr:hypothetical protein QYE76_061876 [Lolium multiflorum]